jgi:hypothetical protein
LFIFWKGDGAPNELGECLYRCCSNLVVYIQSHSKGFKVIQSISKDLEKKIIFPGLYALCAFACHVPRGG